MKDLHPFLKLTGLLIIFMQNFNTTYYFHTNLEALSGFLTGFVISCPIVAMQICSSS
jgi:hypothetical protein